jgi:hypothetical protein
MAYYDITVFFYLESLILFLCLLFSTSHHYYKTDMAFSRTLIYEAWNAHKSVSRNVYGRTFSSWNVVSFASRNIRSRPRGLLQTVPRYNCSTCRHSPTYSIVTFQEIRRKSNFAHAGFEYTYDQLQTYNYTSDSSLKPNSHTGTTPQSTFASLRFHYSKENVGAPFKNVIISTLSFVIEVMKLEIAQLGRVRSRASDEPRSVERFKIRSLENNMPTS